MAFGLDGKVALVTGAASGMGREMAVSLARAGARLALLDVNAGGLAETARMIGGPSSIELVTDVSDAGGCQAAVARVMAEAARLDILVNCAGIALLAVLPKGSDGRATFWTIPPEGYRRIIEINHIGSFNMAHYAVQPMLKAGWGRIINVTTSFDTMLASHLTPYGASKAALEAVTAGWAKELEGTGVTINVLTPGGPTATQMLPEEARRRIKMLEPSVMGPPVVWLASPESDGINGSRFIARDWDLTLPPEQAARAVQAPAGWPEEAARASAKRGRPSTQ